MVVETFPEIPLEPLGSGWTLEAVIGAGGMGTVYRAHNARGERAAVKLLHPNLVGHSGTLKRVLREAELLGKLKHPGICQLKEAGLYGDDRPFLVMELLAGHSLKERHQTAPFSPAELLDFAIQVLEALAYAHGKGVVHRDLKPSNLFLTSQGRVKILDFGVARSLLEDNASQSSVGELIGTPAFMAPEQAAGRHDAVCPQTDIWSLGATLFTLLSGEYVHSGRTEAERLGRAMTVAPRAVRSVLPECPEALAEVIDKALAFEVQDRFRSAVSMRCALKNVSVGERALFVLNRGSGNESGETLVVGRGEKAPSDMVSVASEASASGSRAAGTELSGEFEIPGGPSVRSTASRARSVSSVTNGATSLPSDLDLHALDRELVSNGFDPGQFSPPDFQASLEYERRIAATPMTATVRGMYFSYLLRAAKGFDLGDTDRYIAFRNYPMRDYMDLLVRFARAVYPHLALREGLRRIGWETMPTLLESIVGRVVFAVAGRDLMQVINLAPRAYQLSISPGWVAVPVCSERQAVVEFRGIWNFPECYQVGVMEGVCRTYGRTGVSRVRVLSEQDVDLLIRWF